MARQAFAANDSPGLALTANSGNYPHQHARAAAKLGQLPDPETSRGGAF
jgi:hypothetical protein